MRRMLVLALFLVLTACSSPRADTASRPVEGPAAGSPGVPAPPTAPVSSVRPAAAGSETATIDAATATPTASATSAPGLEDRFYQDANGNVIPDFVELAIGNDPAAPPCPVPGCPGPGGVADAEELRENVLLILDASGSMAGSDGSGRTKMEAARQAVTQYVLGTPASLPLGLMVYGHVGSNDASDKPASCAGVELFAGLGELTAGAVDATLQQFQPTGWTPVAGSLQAAAGAFAGREGQSNRVILVTDGIETCDGDPVVAAQGLHQSGVAVTVDVVGFDIPDADAAALRQVAEVTGGTYTPVRTGADLTAHFVDLFVQRIDLIAQMACVLQAGATTDGCYLTAAGEAGAYLISEFQDEYLGDPRFDELHDLNGAIQDWAGDAAVVLDGLQEDVIPQLQAEAAEAQARFEERFGTQAAFAGSFDCPLDDAALVA